MPDTKKIEGRQISLSIAFFRELSHSESKNEKKKFRFFSRKMTKSGMANTGGNRRSSNFTFNMITFRIGPFRNFFNFFLVFRKSQDHSIIWVDFGRFQPSLSLNISPMAQNFTVCSFAPALYPFCLTSQQVWSKSLKQLSRKCPETTQKGLKNA